MACRSCDLKRIYRLFEEKKRREAKEAEEAVKRALKKKTYVPDEAVVEPVSESVEEVKTEDPIVEDLQSEDNLGLI